MNGDKYCRACGSELNALGNCPHGCRFALDEPMPDMDPKPRHLHLVDDDEDDEPEWNPKV